MHEGAPASIPTLELLEVNLDPAARVDLETSSPPQRRSPWRLATAAVAVVALAALGFAVTRPGSPAAATPTPELVQAVQPPTGIIGFAELYVSTYLTATGPGRRDHVAAFYPSAPSLEEAVATRFIRNIATLDAIDHGDGRWELHVAADVLVHDGKGYLADGIHHYVVGVLDTPHGFTATNLPMRIPEPPRAPVAATAGGSAVEDTALVALIDGFVNAYFAGRGDLRAYVAPGTAITGISPPPFDDVVVDTIDARPLAAGLIELHVIATGSSSRGELSIEQRLNVATSAGTYRIERVTALPPGLPSVDEPPEG